MAISISGLDKLQRQLEEAQRAFASLDGEITSLRFNPRDPTSVESAIADMENAIDARIGDLAQNPIVGPIVAQMKEKYRAEILERARESSSESGEDMVDNTQVDPALLKQIENTVGDLRRADMQSFERHIKKLSRLLHSEQLEPLVRELCKDIDLEAWLKAGQATQLSMVGTARLQWPSDEKKEL